jgi:hypothetical protein
MRLVSKLSTITPLVGLYCLKTKYTLLKEIAEIGVLLLKNIRFWMNQLQIMIIIGDLACSELGQGMYPKRF